MNLPESVWECECIHSSVKFFPVKKFVNTATRIVKFCFLLVEIPMATFVILRTAYEDNVLCQSLTYDLFSHFKNGMTWIVINLALSVF